MGTDCKIKLPTDVRVRDVAKVIAASLGCPTSTEPGGRWTEVEGYEVRGIDTMPERCRIVVKWGTIDRYFLYHFEPEFEGRLIMPSCTAANIALGVRLIQFFGGRLDMNDCDDIEVDLEVERPRATNNPQGGKEWDDFQADLLALKPLTQKEVGKWKSRAAY